MNELVLDVSMWDEGIDLSAWKKKRNVWGVIIKAGGNEGSRYKDPLFEDHYRSAKSLGLHVGAYYYTTSTTKSDARADAEHFAGLLKGKSLDMPAYMDVEDARQYALGRRALTDVIIAFCDTIDASGLIAGIYVNGSTLTNLVYADELAKYAVWVAAWKQGWPSYALDAGLWQQGTMRLSDGYVFFDDVSGCVDASWCRVDYPSKSGGGQDSETGPITATVYIHGGDYDCSELVRMCYRAVDVLPYGSYMWTGSELELLGEHGFKERSLSSPQIGDVLWRSGHTELYLGNGLQGGARHGDYAGGLDGRQGDQDSTEVTRSAYRASEWTKLLRYEGGKTVGGIPAAVAAALVCDHVIDHDAHGYSQPHRSGDGTIETVTITWNGKSEEKSDDEPSGSEGWEVFPVSKTITVRSDSLNVRDAPSTTSGKVVACYSKGDKIIIDGVAINGGYAWGSYIGATSGKRRYVALGSTELAQ